MLRRYVEPEIGAKLLRDVRRTDVQRVIDRMPHHADGEITVGTIKHCYRAMRTALKAGDLRGGTDQEHRVARVDGARAGLAVG